MNLVWEGTEKVDWVVRPPWACSLQLSELSKSQLHQEQNESNSQDNFFSHKKRWAVTQTGTGCSLASYSNTGEVQPCSLSILNSF